MTESGRPSPRVSVIVPTYNRADLLPQTIDSVLQQTLTDFELLIVDDGSTDGTEEVVRGIEDGRVVYLKQAHSGLPAVARNAGLRRARGEYIAFLDSDDLWLPDKLARQVATMDGHPELGLTYTNAYRFEGEPGQYDPRDRLLRPEQAIEGDAFQRLYARQKIPNLTVMIRASVVSAVGLLDEDPGLKANEDYEYWLRIAARYPFGYIDEPLALYRHHPEGISKDDVASNRAKLLLVERLDSLYPEFVARHPHKRRHWLAGIHYGMGRGLLRAGRAAEARRHLARSWTLRPRPQTLLFLAAAYLGSPVYRRLDGARTRQRPRSPGSPR